MEHESVLLQQTIDLLNVRPDGIYVDGTLGRAGHAARILQKLDRGWLYGFDIDQQAIEESRPKLEAICSRFTLIQANYAEMDCQLQAFGVTGVDGILLDLGVSSPQFDDPQRGFSYRSDSRLDMRMDRRQAFSAYELVNEYSEAQITDILYRYGQERYAPQIARAIVAARQKQPVETTGQLADLVKQAMPEKEKKKPGHPAKKTFQAIRIAVNHELDNLSRGLAAGLKLLNPQGRMAVITFHSLEDEIVKSQFRLASQPPQIDKRIPLRADQIPPAEYLLVNRKPLTATAEEQERNHRSHSAKLRVIERRTKA
jgi:16S rRNA (cytosine1402-N4)-methyltransferase